MTRAIPGVLTFQDFQQLTGYQRRSDVERCLIGQGVRIFRGRSGPWTTIDLINQASGIKPGSDDKYGADVI
ncbi:hypothetical protein [Pseudomonas monteilii]|uniref:hypothetical protein n=1 Tax=Pseudomonas monteilii TaxID=76759 RepID=UPI0009B622F4|nr:hypothetical protein [Pseudomonas monteilii]